MGALYLCGVVCNYIKNIVIAGTLSKAEPRVFTHCCYVSCDSFSSYSGVSYENLLEIHGPPE